MEPTPAFPPAPIQADRTPLRIDFIADVVCPWCYIGWRRLQAALALRPEVAGEVRWRAYQLDPTLPEEGVDRRAYYAAKFRDPERARAVGAALQDAAAEDGITMRLADIPKSPNTAAAHRLIRWAQGAGRQREAVEAVLAAYFRDLRDIGDPEVLADIGAEVGLDRMLLLKLLAEGADVEAVAREHATAVEQGISGVPFTVFGGKVAVVGAESPERLTRAIDRALAA